MNAITKILSISFIILLTNVSVAEQLTDIKITSPVMNETMTTREAIEDINTKNSVDGGDLIRNINGINTIRRGGHGLDAVIRGQSDQRLNILLDGAVVYGSCSSKMDPASTYANIENYDSITVIKGNQSVLFGAGGPGGVISFERITEPLPYITLGKGDKKKQPYKFKFGQTFNSNSEAFTTIGDVTLGSGNTYFRLNGSYSDAGSYETGTGIKPKTSYRTHDYAAILGKRLDDGSKLEFIYDNNSQENVGYAGLLMDIVYSYTDMYTLKYHSLSPVGPFSAMNFEIFRTDMDHFMDDYALRTTDSMKTPAASDTYGWRLIGDMDNNLKVGFDFEHNRRDAEQNMKISSTNRHLTYLWPGVEIEKFGLFLEKNSSLSNSSKITYGIRYDQVEADAKKAGDDPGSDHALQVTANSLYTAHYTGTVTASKRDFDNLSGFIRYTKSLNPKNRYFVSLSRSERSPDATELFNAKTSMAMGAKYRLRHIGNPNLKSEEHTAFELGYLGTMWNSDFEASLYINNVDDYVTTYRVSDGTYDNSVNDARVYKNVDATIWGYEASLTKNLTSSMSTTVNINYTHGDDDTQNRPLPQIMPLSGNFSIDYKTLKTNYGLRITFSDTQDRFDSRVLDVGRTGGYAIYDLYVGYEPTPNVRLTGGISNITDKRYATHLNMVNEIDASADRVDEPGRSFWGSLIFEF